MSRLLLKLSGVSKVYPRTVRASQRLSAFWQVIRGADFKQGSSVLENIDFEVQAGESMALVGANGAGKSTLLKIITGVLSPSQGQIERAGSTAALLELGAGFDPEYTGLENLQMNAAFLGLSRREVAEKLDDILAFADIGKAIHEPVKHYSSGMVVRLGFAVVASVKPDLLITDEVLAVGDESFQKKCIRWIESYLGSGGTLLMVSHSMYQVQKLCRRALWLEQGRVRQQGDVFDVTQAYLAWHERKQARELEAEQDRRSTSATLVTVTNMALNEQSVEAAGAAVRLPMGSDLSIRFELRSPDGRPPVVLVGIVRADGTPVYGVANEHDDWPLIDLGDSRFGGTLHLPDLILLPGEYSARIHALDPEGLRVHDTREAIFTVQGQSREMGLVRLPHQWAKS